EIRNDARANLITSMLIAAEYPLPEVCLYFGGKLLRGCRAVKVDADGLDAFDSPKFPPLGVAGVEIQIDLTRVHSTRTSRPGTATGRGVAPLGVSLAAPRAEATVGAFRLFPGLAPDLLRNVLQPPLQGLVLEAYGVGNGPDRDVELLAALTEAASRGVVIVAITQCLRGAVRLGEYVAGSALAKAGVISGGEYYQGPP
ncbi:MAG TPA: asparaginase domain-containing protein, partial [Chromatiaceae bacterium]|nr:asparaginase domain-containing protein [Chromatiaceae bacterium]